MLTLLVRKKIIENYNNLVVISLSKVSENEFLQTSQPTHKVESSYKRSEYFPRASLHTKDYLPHCKVSRRTYRITSRNRPVKLWYMTNIPDLERRKNVGKKLGVNALLPMLCRLCFSKSFQSDNQICGDLNNNSLDFLSSFIEIVFELLKLCWSL